MKGSDVDEREVDETLDDNLMSSFGREDALENELEEANLIEEWCPECREIQPHALVQDTTRRIVCAECRHEQERSLGPVASEAKSLLLAEEAASEEGRYAAWKRLTQAADESEIKAYSIRQVLEEGDVIKHVTFGLGVVLSLTERIKAEVLFSDKTRRLVCGK